MVIVSRLTVRETVLRHYSRNGRNIAQAIADTATELCLSVEAVREALGGFA
jgi:hypothetical protein